MLDQNKLVQAEEIYLDPELVANIQARLSRMEGQVRGIKRMLDEKEECEKILVQMSSIRAALNQATVKLLEGHMDTCITNCVQTGDEKALDRLKTALSLVLRNA
jgi:CsoR family transcriptional regulator, copper-sensing transcriptional repressor